MTGAHRSRDFTLDAGASHPIAIEDLTISAGTAIEGAGVHNAGALILTSDTLATNAAIYGAAVYNATGTATLTNDTFTGNSASLDGAGV